MIKWLILLFLAGATPVLAQGSAKQVSAEDRSGIAAAIATYNKGLTSGDSRLFRSSIAGGIFMFNGAKSDDPTGWEAHMYQPPERMETWSENFVKGAGPHFNEYQLLSVNVRANAAVATTEDTGRNKFRSWSKERITWMLARVDGSWKIIGFFIKDATNPG
jgi:hypothetical protein